MVRTSDIRIRVDARQRAMIEHMAKVCGHSTVSSYCRSKLFEEFSIHNKLNKILEHLETEGDQDDVRT